MTYDLTPEKLLNILGDKVFPPEEFNELLRWSTKEDPLKWLRNDARPTNVSLFYLAAAAAPQNLLAALVVIFAILKAVEVRQRPTLSDRQERKLLRMALGQWLRYVRESSPFDDLSNFLNRLALSSAFLTRPRGARSFDEILDDPPPPRRPRLSLRTKPAEIEEPPVTKITGLLAPVLIGPPPVTSDNCEAASVLAKFQRLAEPIPRTPMPNPNRWRTELTAEFPWASELFASLAAELSLAKRTGQQHFRLPPLLIVGRPGIGKTRIAAAIAAAAGAPVHVFQASSHADPVAFAGMAPSFKNSTPSFPLCQMLEVPVCNPVIVIDEIDKAGASNGHGRLLDALLPLLEMTTAARWTDVFLQQAADLSAISWIAIANSDSDLPRPFLSRCLRLDAPPPTAESANVIIPRLLKDLFGEGPAPSLDAAIHERLAGDLNRYGDIRRVQRALRAALRNAEWPLLH